MKRDANYEDEDAMEDFNSWLGDGNTMEIGKRSGKSFLSLSSFVRYNTSSMVQLIRIHAKQNCNSDGIA